MSTAAKPPHPWMLTGPWYRWAAPGVPEAGRSSKPEIQKYAGFDFAAEFVREPQRSLIWTDEDYFHRTVQRVVPPPNVPPPPGTWLREKTQIRKLYKPTHARNYVVVVELHCDVAGLPNVARSEVAEAGFVVRRLSARFDDPAVAARATAALQEVAVAKEQVKFLERNAKGRIRSASGLVKQRWLDRPVIKKQHELLDQWLAGKLALDELAAAGAFGLDTQAWIPDELDPHRGRWQTLTDAAPRTDLDGELSVPLYPLIPDPREDGHSAAGRTVYFGVIPTGGREAEGDGAPRFDEHHLYEIRCFVRRHPHKPGCPGELVWSEPTVGYRIAPDADPEGTSNLPISISVPSMRDVQAFADRIATGGAGGVRIVQPPDSVMPIVGDFPDLDAGSKTGIGQICFIAILLLFMIALFLMFAFLPVIVFLFQLYFLLRLKFCIPPAIELDLEIAASIKAELDVEFAIGAEITAEASFQIGADFKADFLANNGKTLETWANEQLDALFASAPDMRDYMKTKLSLEAKLQRILDLGTDFRGSIDAELADSLNFADWSADPIPAPDSNALAPALPSGPKLEYYAVLDPREVFA